ncbi:MAG: ribonuclease III [Alphaproteobacteria bacterium]|nr:ribonuclease III [Alphaproteobacteria bacterium]
MTRRTVKPADDLSALESALGHRFADRSLLQLALTHASAGASRLGDNQRLEFLGDRVLSLIVAELLYQRFPGEEEGALARRHAALVRQEALTEVARAIALGSHLRFAGGEAAGKRREGGAGALADACEALIAALYLDGGLAAARAFVARAWEGMITADPTPPRDAKTALQEWAQARGEPLPRYAIVGREGPDHEPLFTVTATLKDGRQAKASGANKRAAEQAAAAVLLEQIGAPQ